MENSGFATATVRRHISMFRGYGLGNKVIDATRKKKKKYRTMHL
jgi:hypothetical protein